METSGSACLLRPESPYPITPTVAVVNPSTHPLTQIYQSPRTACVNRRKRVDEPSKNGESATPRYRLSA